MYAANSAEDGLNACLVQITTPATMFFAFGINAEGQYVCENYEGLGEFNPASLVPCDTSGTYRVYYAVAPV